MERGRTGDSVCSYITFPYHLFHTSLLSVWKLVSAAILNIDHTPVGPGVVV